MIEATTMQTCTYLPSERQTLLGAGARQASAKAAAGSSGAIAMPTSAWLAGTQAIKPATRMFVDVRNHRSRRLREPSP